VNKKFLAQSDSSLRIYNWIKQRIIIDRRVLSEYLTKKYLTTNGFKKYLLIFIGGFIAIILVAFLFGLAFIPAALLRG
jgi:hypothetical protein